MKLSGLCELKLDLKNTKTKIYTKNININAHFPTNNTPFRRILSTLDTGYSVIDTTTNNVIGPWNEPDQ